MKWTSGEAEFSLTGLPYLCYRYQGHDVIAQAQSGTGKTATFAISVLESLDVNVKECQSLILAPTRELAQQIQKVRIMADVDSKIM